MDPGHPGDREILYQHRIRSLSWRQVTSNGFPAPYGAWSHQIHDRLNVMPDTMMSTAPLPTTVTTNLETRTDVMRLLLAVRTPGVRRRLGRIVVRVPGLSAAEMLKTELRLNAHAQDCGCTVGSAFMSAAAAGAAFYVWLLPGSERLRASSLLPVAAVVLISAGLGKLVGIVRAKALLVEEVERLAARVESLEVEAGNGDRM